MVSRFNRDVVAQPGVGAVVLFGGVNDLGTLGAAAGPEAHAALVRAMIEGMRQLVLRARAHHIRIYGATITPFGGSATYPLTETLEADRQAINAWIREKGHFDRVIDFDAVMRDPANPERLNPLYDSGDHLHASPSGYKAMGEAAARAVTGRRARAKR